MRLQLTAVTCPCRGPGAVVVQTILRKGGEGRGGEHHELHVTQTATAGPPIQM